MLVKILGGIDLIGGLILIVAGSMKLPLFILLAFAAILIIKAIIGGFRDFAGWIDITASILFVLSIFFQIPWVICLIGGILLIQKGAVSFL
jgi:hypothetical protein